VKYYTIVFPGEFGQHVQETWTREQILKVYWTSWNRKMFQSGNSDKVSEENCIEDWIVTHWAEETDEFGNKLEFLDNIKAGEKLVSDKGYEESTLEKVEEFAKNRNYHYSNTDNPIDFPRCTCHTCLPISALDPTTMFMRLCPTCGNKRCPKATHHDNACTNSNEPNQEGSIY
jgi:hypothetical protein